jgi:hypothetical protein
MENCSDVTSVDMYSCASTAGRRQIPASRGVLSLDDPTFKTLPKPAQALAKFAAACNYLTENGCDGELWWKVGMAVNGEEQLELDVLYGVSIQSDTSTKRLLSSTKVNTHTIRFFPNTILCVKFDTTTEESKNKLRSICDKDSYRTSMLALQSWTVAHATLTFAAAAFKEGYKDTKLLYGIMKGALTVTERPYLTVHNEDASRELLEEILDSCRTGGVEYFRWVRKLGTIDVCSRRVEEDDEGEPVPIELCTTAACGWVRIGPKRVFEPAPTAKRARLPSRVNIQKRVPTDVCDIGLMSQKVTSQRIMDATDKIHGLSSGDKTFAAVRLTMIALGDKKSFVSYATATPDGAKTLAGSDHTGTLTLFTRCCNYVNSRYGVCSLQTLVNTLEDDEAARGFIAGATDTERAAACAAVCTTICGVIQSSRLLAGICACGPGYARRVYQAAAHQLQAAHKVTTTFDAVASAKAVNFTFRGFLDSFTTTLSLNQCATCGSRWPSVKVVLVDSGVIEDALHRDPPRSAAMTLAAHMIRVPGNCSQCLAEVTNVARVVMSAGYAYSEVDLGELYGDNEPVADISELNTTSLVTEVFDIEDPACDVMSPIPDLDDPDGEYHVQRLIFHYYASWGWRSGSGPVA